MQDELMKSDTKTKIIKVIEEYTYTTEEALQRLEISRQRLQVYRKNGKLKPISKDLYYKGDVEAIRELVIDDNKHYRTNPLIMFPICKDIENILLINTNRLADCSAMVRKTENPKQVFLDELAKTLEKIYNAFNNNKEVFYVRNKSGDYTFDTVKTERELFELENSESNVIASQLTLDPSAIYEFKEVCKDTENPFYISIIKKNVIESLELQANQKLGLEKAANFTDVFNLLQKKCEQA